jgi:hypothetical protein
VEWSIFALMSERSPEADIKLRWVNVAEVPIVLI